MWVHERIFFAATPAFCPSLSTDSTCRYFLPGKRFRGRDGEMPPEKPQRPREPDLTEREKRLYLVLAIVGCLPLLMLVVLWFLMHSPLVAN